MTLTVMLTSNCKNTPKNGLFITSLPKKSGITGDSKPTGSKVIFLLAPTAILDISNCSRISACYPLDVRYRGPKDVESSEKKTISAGAGYTCLET